MNYPIREGFMTMEKIRESVIAGSWYSDDPQTLKHEIARYLENADISSIEGEVVGLVALHAGYMYLEALLRMLTRLSKAVFR